MKNIVDLYFDLWLLFEIHKIFFSFRFFFCSFDNFFFLASNYDSSRIRTESNRWFHGWEYTQFSVARHWIDTREEEKTIGSRDIWPCICGCICNPWNVCQCMRMFICDLFNENNELTQSHTHPNVKWCISFRWNALNGKFFSLLFYSFHLCFHINTSIRTKDGAAVQMLIFNQTEISCFVYAYKKTIRLE